MAVVRFDFVISPTCDRQRCFSWVMFTFERSPGFLQTARRSGHDEESDAEQGANSAFKLFDLDQIWHPFNRGKCDQ